MSTKLAMKKRPKATYRSSPTKRARRSKSDILALRTGMRNIILAERPMTVRQVYYRMVSAGMIDKTEAEYKTTICRLLVEMRRDGEIDYDDIADGTRWQRKPRSYSSLEGMLEQTARFYRRSLWDNQEAYVEVWLEKDALSGVLYGVTAEWDVPLMVTRGYPSLSYLHSAGEAIAEQDKPTFLYYFGDHDPSGVDIPRKVIQELRGFAPHADIHFERVAVLPSQIEQFDLPTRPTKTSDSRSKNFAGESVEVDAIPPATLRQLASACIEQHIDQEALSRLRTVEAAERSTLHHLAADLRSDGNS